MILGINGRLGSGKDTVGKIIQKVLIKENATYMDERSNAYISQLTPEGLAYKSGWKVKKFAFKLKQIASLLTGVPIEKWEDQEFKKTFMPNEWDYLKQMFETNEHNKDGYSTMPMTYREFLQRLGTEAIRDGLHANTWVNALFADYRQVVGYAPGNYTCKCGQCKKQFIGDKRAIRCEECSIFYPNWIITDMRFPNEFETVKKRDGICIRVIRTHQGELGNKAEAFILHPSETALDKHQFDYVLQNNGTIDDLVVEVQKMLSHFKLIP